MNWYIGQDIVCIKTSSDGVVVKNKVYTICRLRNSCCKCNDIEIDVGLRSDKQFISCIACGTWMIPSKDGINWKSDALFAPLDQDISELTLVVAYH